MSLDNYIQGIYDSMNPCNQIEHDEEQTEEERIADLEFDISYLKKENKRIRLLLREIKELAEASDNGICIIIKNKIY